MLALELRYPRLASMARLALPLLASLAFPLAPLYAASPVGDEFQVNSTTTGEQRRPDVAAAAGGGFVVVWESTVSPGNDTDGSSILGQRFDAAGQPVAAEFQVNSSTTYNQTLPRIASRADGSFVVVWRSVTEGNKGLLGSLQARAFDPSGSPVGNDFQVALPINIYQYFNDHDVAATTAGEFVIAAADFYNDFIGSYSGGVTVQRFSDSGAELGPASLLRTVPDQLTVSLAAGLPGSSDFVVAWRKANNYSQYLEAESQRLSADGIPTGPIAEAHPPLGVASGSTSDAAFNEAGEWVVAWDGYDSYQYPPIADGSEIYGRRIGSDGIPAPGAAKILNQGTANNQLRPRLALGNDRLFLLVWNDIQGSELAVQSRLLDQQGSPLGNDLAINSPSSLHQADTRVAASSDRSHFLVVWTTANAGTDFDGTSVRARLLAADGIFVDGFESGNTEEWSASLP